MPKNSWHASGRAMLTRLGAALRTTNYLKAGLAVTVLTRLKDVRQIIAFRLAIDC